mmetsp:Transcript_15084/g.16356  ORF Transcript_15084/g.16356 Transcript_15084/m.16356 type:complete len:248 (-) Transcript_15084:243-986(-)|eukprot:gene12887-14119_t
MEKINKYFSRPTSSCEATKPNCTVGTPEKPQRRHSLESGLSRPSTASKNNILSPRKILPLNDQPTGDIEEQFLERKRRLSEIAEGVIVGDYATLSRPRSSIVKRNSVKSIITEPTTTSIPHTSPNLTSKTATTTSTLQKIAKFQFLDFTSNNKNNNNNEASVVSKVRGDWREDIHGGVKMWVNIKTNEVSVSNPFPQDEGEGEKRKFLEEENGTFRVKKGPIPKGTATTLYDQSAVSEMFKLLDEQT